MCWSSSSPRGRDATLTCEPRTLLRLTGESLTGRSPGTPSIVSRPREPRPTSRPKENWFGTLRTRTVSPSTHPCPASDGATDFLPASALRHHEALRPQGGKDARCVRTMSATQSNRAHPHLARSRLALAAFAAGTPRGVLGSARHDRGTGRFTTSETASADRHRTLTS